VANETSGLTGLGVAAFRVKRLNCDGTPVDTGDDNCDVAGYAGCKITQITRTAIVVEGETFTQANAAGLPCVNVTLEDTTTGYTYTFQQCDVDYELKEILGVVPSLLVDAEGDTIGAQLDGGTQSCGCSVGDAACRDIALEYWLKAWRCSEQVGFFRHVVPRIKFTSGTETSTFGNEILLETFTGDSKPNSNMPVTGPWGDIPAATVVDGGSPSEFFEATLPGAVEDAVLLGTYIPCDFTGTSPSS